MNNLFLFLPENDMALAAGVANYTPTRQAAAVARAGRLLPWWLGDPDDCVLVRDALPAQLARVQQMLSERFGPGPRLIAAGELDGLNLRGSLRPQPWGWSRYAARIFEQAGVPLPAGMDFDRHRELSHRRTSLTLHRELGKWGSGEVEAPDATEITCAEDIFGLMRQWNAVFVKTPWSSSGRGVWRVTADITPGEITKLRGAIRRQGSVIVQRAYDKVADFAMLFHYTPHNARFAGYSLFFTGAGAGAYSGNCILVDEAIERRLGAHVGPQTLHALRERVARALETVLGDGYAGPVGVDMLVTERGTVAPCIEINLRYTMGFVAHAMALRTAAGADYLPERILTLSDGFMGLPLSDFM